MIPRSDVDHSPARGLVLAVALSIALLGIFQSAPPSHAAFVGNDLTAAPDSWGVNVINTQRRNLDASGTTYTGFSVGGVLTSMSVKTQGTAGVIDVYVLRKTTAATPTTQNFLSLAPVTSVAVPEFMPGEGTITTVPTRLSVQPGDQFGASALVDGTRFLDWHSASEATGYCFMFIGTHAVGAVATYHSEICNNYIPLVRGYVEADADGDGYGDESQDLCPTDPSVHDACPLPSVFKVADLSVRIKRSKRPVPGLRATMLVTVTNKGPATADRIVVSVDRARKLKSWALLRHKLCSLSRTKRACVFKELAPGASVTLKARAVKRMSGKIALVARASSGASDPVAKNNKSRTAVRFRR